MLDCQMFGLQAGRHHLVNLLLHVATTVLVFLVLRQLTGAFWKSAFVAALFGWHPAHVESVAWISERKDVLCALFWMLTIWAYARYAKLKGQGSRFKGAYLLALMFFLFALMSKPMAVTLPFVLLLLDIWPLRRVSISSSAPDMQARLVPLVLEKMSFFALSALACVVTYFAQIKEGALQSGEVLPLHRRIDNAFISYVRYIGELIWPHDLTVFYPYPNAWPKTDVIAAMLVLITLTVFVLRQARVRPYIGVGWFWFIGTLVPVIGVVQAGMQSMADRYTYLPAIGFFVVVVWSLGELVDFKPKIKFMAVGASMAALLACSVATATQARLWHDTRSVFEHAVKVTRNNMMAHFILAQLDQREQHPAEAQKHLDEALNIAVAHFEAAVIDTPDSPRVHADLADGLAKQGKLAEASEHFATALRLDPDFAPAHLRWAMALKAEGKIDEAGDHLVEALKINPNYAAARQQLELLFRENAPRK
jgi:hypothetical protein